MKKKIKKIFLIIAVVCFLVLFVSPRPSSAFAEEGETFNEGVISDFGDDVIQNAYSATSEWFDYMQTGQREILSQFYTYAYVGVKYRALQQNGEFVEATRDYCIVVGRIQNLGSYTLYSGNENTCYFDSRSLTPVFGGETFRMYNNRLEIGGVSYHFEPNFKNYNRIVTYCDFPRTYYTNHVDSLSHVDLSLAHFPPPKYGVVSSQAGTLGDNIQDTLDRWIPPAPTTLPPFIPPETLPPATLPPEILTVYPPATDLDGSYIIDYQPYIYGDFFPITTIQDDTIITASGSIIAYSWDMLTADEQIKSIVLLILVLSLVLGLLT